MKYFWYPADILFTICFSWIKNCSISSNIKNQSPCYEMGDESSHKKILKEGFMVKKVNSLMVNSALRALLLNLIMLGWKQHNLIYRKEILESFIRYFYPNLKPQSKFFMLLVRNREKHKKLDFIETHLLRLESSNHL